MVQWQKVHIVVGVKCAENILEPLPPTPPVHLSIQPKAAVKTQSIGVHRKGMVYSRDTCRIKMPAEIGGRAASRWARWERRKWHKVAWEAGGYMV